MEHEEAKSHYQLGAFHKRHPDDKIWYIEVLDRKGPILFSFDKTTIFNFWPDYPDKLTAEQKALFDKENPELASMHDRKRRKRK